MIALFISLDVSPLTMLIITQYYATLAMLNTGKNEYYIEVMLDLYRAPEIIFGIPWNCKIDIWSVGLLVIRCGRL
jgi:hypothetical protein